MENMGSTITLPQWKVQHHHLSGTHGKLQNFLYLCVLIYKTKGREEYYSAWHRVSIGSVLSLPSLLIHSTPIYPSHLSLCHFLRETFLDSSEQEKSPFYMLT